MSDYIETRCVAEESHFQLLPTEVNVDIFLKHKKVKGSVFVKQMQKSFWDKLGF